MTNNILALKKAGHLTCTWIATGDPRTPLACVWAQPKGRSSAKEALSPNDDSGRVLCCEAVA
jgi:hypothetical protein